MRKGRYEYLDIEEKVLMCLWVIVWLLICIFMALLLSGCTTTKYVPVVETHDVHHYHTDSIHNTDSVIHEKETTIMQLDSAAMAQYGIQLKSAERAWLVKTKELELQIQRLMALSVTKDSIHDSIPVPYPVERKLTKWERTKIELGGWAILILLIPFGYGVWRIGRKFSLF